jgi:phosphatidylglycerol:prolipoprotein diacylglycerol transferase
VAWNLTGVPLETPLHPTQLYESAVEFVLFVWLFRLSAKSHPPGRILGLYLVVSSIARFGIEFLRFHQQALQGGLSLTQWMSIALAAAGAVLLARTRKTTAVPQTVHA